MCHTQMLLWLFTATQKRDREKGSIEKCRKIYKRQSEIFNVTALFSRCVDRVVLSRSVTLRLQCLSSTFSYSSHQKCVMHINIYKGKADCTAQIQQRWLLKWIKKSYEEMEWYEPGTYIHTHTERECITAIAAAKVSNNAPKIFENLSPGARNFHA